MAVLWPLSRGPPWRPAAIRKRGSTASSWRRSSAISVVGRLRERRSAPKRRAGLRARPSSVPGDVFGEPALRRRAPHPPSPCRPFPWRSPSTAPTALPCRPSPLQRAPRPPGNSSIRHCRDPHRGASCRQSGGRGGGGGGAYHCAPAASTMPSRPTIAPCIFSASPRRITARRCHAQRWRGVRRGAPALRRAARRGDAEAALLSRPRGRAGRQP